MLPCFWFLAIRLYYSCTCCYFFQKEIHVRTSIVLLCGISPESAQFDISKNLSICQLPKNSVDLLFETFFGENCTWLKIGPVSPSSRADDNLSPVTFVSNFQGAGLCVVVQRSGKETVVCMATHGLPSRKTNCATRDHRTPLRQELLQMQHSFYPYRE